MFFCLLKDVYNICINLVFLVEFGVNDKRNYFEIFRYIMKNILYRLWFCYILYFVIFGEFFYIDF